MTDAVVARISSFTQDVLGEFLRTAPDPPTTLYHYTSAEGLKGILDTQTFWMTDVRYMNDLSELQYANDLMTERLTLRLEKEDSAGLRAEYLRRLRARALHSSSPDMSAVYCTSFCQDGNLLSQWRAYSGRGGGYAIGLDFIHTLGLLDKSCNLVRMTYEKDSQVTSIDHVVGRYLGLIGLLDEMAPSSIDDLLVRTVESFLVATRPLLLSLKHPDFKEEKEWRLVYLTGSHPRYDRGAVTPRTRTFEGNIVPYREVGFSRAIALSKDDTFGVRFPIVSITIGPTVNAVLNRDSVFGIMVGLAPDVDHDIRDSGIPLRWL